jgi:hypothetical protein
VLERSDVPDAVTEPRSPCATAPLLGSLKLGSGCSRLRYHNMLHLVGDHVEEAQAQIIEAAGRHRADRGLDMARALATC